MRFWLYWLMFGGILLTLRGICRLILTLHQDGWF